jgi:hypothetical protein
MQGNFAECGLVVVSRDWSCYLYLKDFTVRTERVNGSAMW